MRKKKKSRLLQLLLNDRACLRFWGRRRQHLLNGDILNCARRAAYRPIIVISYGIGFTTTFRR